MDYKILFSDEALNDLSSIIEYIAADNPETASSVGRSLIEHVKILQSSPHIGTTVHKRRHARKIFHSPYTIYYRIHEARRIVEVIHFWHGRRRGP